MAQFTIDRLSESKMSTVQSTKLWMEYLKGYQKGTAEIYKNFQLMCDLHAATLQQLQEG